MLRGESSSSRTCLCTIPFLEQNLCKTRMPFGVSCQTALLDKKSVLPSQDSIKRAARNLSHMDWAISLAMEKVVVVVVVTILDGSFGSGMRFDCENLREPRFVMASSVVKVCSILENRTL